jgi:cytochrome c oxidase subunit 2
MTGPELPRVLRDMLNLPPEGSTVAAPVDWLHLLVISTTMLGSIGVALFAYAWLRRSRQKAPMQLTRRVVPSLASELGLAGVTLGIFFVFWVIGYYVYLDIREPPSDRPMLVVYLTAKQWMWKFSYPDGRATNDVLVVPQGQPVKLVMTSRDVIHSFYVPAFRIKQDVVPGRYIVSWFQSDTPGTYPIDCAEYCGLSHSEMRGEVVVLRPSEYARWMEQNAPAGAEKQADLATYGHDVAARYQCFACHTIDGQPHIGPTWSRLYDSLVELDGGRRVKADEAYLTRSMMEPNADIVRGYKPVMPTFYGRLSHVDVAALVELIRSLKDGPFPPLVELPSLQITAQDGGAPEADR